MSILDQSRENLLYGWVSGQLPEAEKEGLLQWLQEDPSHQLQLSEVADTWALAHVPFFASNVKQDFEVHFPPTDIQIPPLKKSRRFYSLSIWQIVASLLAVATIGVVCFMAGGKYTNSTTPTAYQEIITLPGSTSKIVLPDSTLVWLNAGSSMKYKADFNHQFREVELSGEARFQVKESVEKPFIVHSKEVNVEVTGTHFNIKTYENDETVMVSLLTGSVKVLLHDRQGRGDTVSLVPNDMLCFRKETGNATVKKTDVNELMSWSEGILRFTKLPFPQLARDLERKFNIRLHIVSERLKNEIFTGSFLSHYTLEDILREIDVDQKYQWEKVQTNELVIRDR